MAETPVSLDAGIVDVDGGALVVVLPSGARLRAVLWPAWSLAPGDRVRVLTVDGVTQVLSPVFTSPRPVAGSVAGAASAGLVPVTTTAGTVHARYTGTAPTLGTLVALVWGGTTPLILPGVLASTPSDPIWVPSPTEPPTGPPTGVSAFSAVESGTWNLTSGGWSSANADSVTQGTWSGIARAGSWWYGTGPTMHAGKTITRLRIRVPARVRQGNYNSAVALQFYRHTSVARSGDSVRVEGPHSHTLPPIATPAPRWPGDPWVDLPPGWGQSIADAGGGIAITGGDYAGVDGVPVDPTSGQLEFTWEA